MLRAFRSVHQMVTRQLCFHKKVCYAMRLARILSDSKLEHHFFCLSLSTAHQITKDRMSIEPQLSLLSNDYHAYWAYLHWTRKLSEILFKKNPHWDPKVLLQHASGKNQFTAGEQKSRHKPRGLLRLPPSFRSSSAESWAFVVDFSSTLRDRFSFLVRHVPIAVLKQYPFQS